MVTDEFGEIPPYQPELTEYRPYGTPRHGSALNTVTDYNFTDQEIDRSTGLYNYDARLYNPDVAMFITADSMLPNVYDPQLLNRYAYARNNPMTYIDPSGHVPENVYQHELDEEGNVTDTTEIENDELLNTEVEQEMIVVDAGGNVSFEQVAEGTKVGDVTDQAGQESTRSFGDIETTAKTKVGQFFQRLGKAMSGGLRREVSVNTIETTSTDKEGNETKSTRVVKAYGEWGKTNTTGYGSIASFRTVGLEREKGNSARITGDFHSHPYSRSGMKKPSGLDGDVGYRNRLSPRNPDMRFGIIHETGVYYY